jgi:hypothetical protein
MQQVDYRSLFFAYYKALLGALWTEAVTAQLIFLK